MNIVVLILQQAIDQWMDFLSFDFWFEDIIDDFETAIILQFNANRR